MSTQRSISEIEFAKKKISITKYLISYLLSTMILVSGCAVKMDPVNGSHISAKAWKKINQTISKQQKINGKLDLYQAMARAVKYNLDYKVAEMEYILNLKNLDLAHYQLLPNIVANAQYSGRNNQTGGRSQSIRTGNQSLEASTSREKNIFNTNAEFSWNILDFGLSYVRAKQAADRTMIAQEQRKKVSERIIQNTRTAYWRAVGSDRIAAQLIKFQKRIERAIQNMKTLRRTGKVNPLQALEEERNLVEISQRVKNIQAEIKTAKFQLAALINVPPNTNIQIKKNKKDEKIFHFNMKPQKMVKTALANRTELRELFYQKRINQREVEAKLLELLPGINLYASADYDSNKFLYHASWIAWGAKASWNLIRIFQYPAQKKVVKAKDEVIKQQILATAMAIMTQIHVSHARYTHAKNQFKLAQQKRNIQNKFLKQAKAQSESEIIGEQKLIKEELNAILAELQYDVEYANLQSAYANLIQSMGIGGKIIDNIDIKNITIENLAKKLQKNLR